MLMLCSDNCSDNADQNVKCRHSAAKLVFLSIVFLETMLVNTIQLVYKKVLSNLFKFLTHNEDEKQ